MSDFTGFKSIERWGQPVVITEKIHGTNAQLVITDGVIEVGSRSRWITVADDNFGFAAWVDINKEELVTKLGEGQHYGEWYGRGINAGYGMKDRRFALFNTHRWNPIRDAGELPSGVDVVPTLYTGAYGTSVVDDVMADLRQNGSKLVPGYNKPEGVVIFFVRSNIMMKRTFESEDEAWTCKAERLPTLDRTEAEEVCAPFWQPLRLEKLLSRDERLMLLYPASLREICSAYITDLEKEVEIEEDTRKLVRKGVFRAIKAMMVDRGFSV